MNGILDFVLGVLCRGSRVLLWWFVFEVFCVGGGGGFVCGVLSKWVLSWGFCPRIPNLICRSVCAIRTLRYLYSAMICIAILTNHILLTMSIDIESHFPCKATCIEYLIFKYNCFEHL